MKHIFCIAVFAALFGCKQVPTPDRSNSGGDVEPVLLSDVRILFEAPAFAGQQVSRAKITDTWQREEYALFRSPRAQAEIVYLAATARETNLETGVKLKTMIRRWNFNGQAGINGGEEFEVFGRVLVLPYLQPYHACFGFSAEWAPALDDAESNPSKMLFGYCCELVTAPLTRARVNALVDSIEV